MIHKASGSHQLGRLNMRLLLVEELELVEEQLCLGAGAGLGGAAALLAALLARILAR